MTYERRGSGVTPDAVAGLRQAALGIEVANGTYDLTTLPAYRTLTGHNPPAQLVFVPWADPNTDGSNLFPRWMLDNVMPSGVTPVITWTPLDFTNPSATQSAFQLDDINNGTYDTYVNTWAAACKAWGRPVVIRLMHEMNGNWYPWAIGAPSQGNTAAKFVTAWRRIHGLFTTLAVTNAQWAWCPNTAYGTTFPFTDCYPGDAYVDQLGLDAYNYGDNEDLGTGVWLTADQLYSADLDTLAGISSTKPICIFETASVEAGGDKAAWITDTFGRYLKTRPQVKGVFWFHEDKSGSGEVDYRVNTSPEALAAWLDIVKDPYWGGPYLGTADTVNLVSDALASEKSLRSAQHSRLFERTGETCPRNFATLGVDPGKGVVHYEWFVPRTSFTVGHIRFPLADGVTGSGLTSAFVGIYTFDGTTLTRVATTADVDTLFNGVTDPNIPISGPAVTAGTPYVVAFVFNGTTAPKLWGSYPAYGHALEAPEICGSASGTTLPSTIAKASLGSQAQLRVEVTT